ncbi:MogA/MoaB family molybdenum cofactor biosynthesis protein [Sporosarcina sp. CAU 1771]
MAHNVSKEDSLAFAVLTISDSRKEANDRSGSAIRKQLEEAGHQVVARQICHDERVQIEEVIEKWIADSKIQVIITTGGTGISHRDITVDTVTPYFTKTLDGFGELFRFLSYTKDVGSKALLSRATAGIVNEKVLFLLPGSVKAVELAMNDLILQEAHHIVHELGKHKIEEE